MVVIPWLFLCDRLNSNGRLLNLFHTISAFLLSSCPYYHLSVVRYLLDVGVDNLPDTNIDLTKVLLADLKLVLSEF